MKHPSGRVYINTAEKAQSYLDPQDSNVPESFKVLFGRARHEAEAQVSGKVGAPPSSTMSGSAKTAPSGLDTSAKPDQASGVSGEHLEQESGKGGGSDGASEHAVDPLLKFGDDNSLSDKRDTIFVNAQRDVVDWDREQYHVGQALAQQADLFFMSLFNNRDTDIGLEFLVHEQQLRATGEPICVITALVFVHQLISDTMKSTNYHNVLLKNLDEFIWNSDSNDFWRKWLKFSETVSDYENMTGQEYTKVGKFVVALKERFDAYHIQWNSKGGKHPWHHLRVEFDRLHNMHDVVIEQKSAREVVDIVRSIQDEHSKEISDGAGNRIV